MAWIELHQELREHKKLFACADELKVGRMQMVGMLVSLWLWALDNAQDGSLEGISNRTIARVCDWSDKKADALIAALCKTGWLDKHDGAYHIHDWFDYAGKLMESRKKDRERKRSRKKESDRNSDGIPPEQPRNSAATVHYSTVQYPTVPNNCGGDGGECAREATAEELRSIGLTPGVYCGITGTVVRQVKHLTGALIADREPCAADFRNVFMRLLIEGGTATKDSCELLQYAFETAEAAGHKGDWAYINGVLDKLASRGITTTKDAIMYDATRPDKEDGL